MWLPTEAFTQYVNELFGEAAFFVVAEKGAPVLKEVASRKMSGSCSRRGCASKQGGFL
jgi:hypothetical protein